MKAPKSDRPQMKPHTFILRDEDIRKRALALLQHMPIDRSRPLQVIIREESKARKLDQNALMFAGPLNDIAEQAWVNGKQYSIEVWHDHCKRSFLPAAFDPEICLDGYRKWDVAPSGEMILIGSTTQLTIKGMAQYIEQIHAFGAHLGVQFHTKE